MQIETHGQQMDVTPALREYVDNKLARLQRHFDHPCTVRVQLAVDRPHHRAEATVNVAGRSMHTDATAPDMYAAIDVLADKLDRLLVKHKEKRSDHKGGESLARMD